MSKPTVLLTGATGFLGSYLLEALLRNGHKVAILKRSTSNLWRIKHLIDQVTSYDVDMQPLEVAFEQQHIDVVIHTACHYGRNGSSTSEIVETNLVFGLKILETAVNHKVTTFINTDSLLPRNLNTYSLSKKQLVDWLKQHSSKIQVINLKLEHMYGPKDDSTKFIASLVTQLKENAPEIKLTSGVQRRDFIYIDDVVSAFLIVLKKSKDLPEFSEFEVGTGESTEIKTFVENLKWVFEKLYGKTTTQLNFGAIPYREGEIMEFKVDNQALRQLGWNSQVLLQQGLEHSLKESL
ncbi:MAG: epimerase [Piscirickettsiaceae bacterium CG_4_10_14_3_um_filter_44_349]|nr:MAG: epimerase [Thiomicrospira sp. CG2_30_44_34]PIX80367.1 MAG: epimerase [Piscirickettsiaceae bacterium CG_4_10_14_3_um_filter_44_349]